MSFSRIGTETVASLAATKHPSANKTRPLYAHRYGNKVLSVFQSLRSLRSEGSASLGGDQRIVKQLRFASVDYLSTTMAESEQLPTDRVAMLRMMPMPSDANIHGDVFGGWIMSHVDVAGAIPAARRAGGRVATVAVTSFVFRQAVFVGDLVSFYAEIAKIGTTSITVNVEVYVERNRLDREVVKVTEATLVYVATDEQRKPRTLPAV